MFTIKLYKHDGAYQRIHEADSFSVLREYKRKGTGPSYGWAEVTAHQKNGDSVRFDVGDSPHLPSGGNWERCIIENSAGRTTEIIGNNIPLQNAA